MKPTPLNTLPRTVNEMLRHHGEKFYTWKAENIESGSYSRSEFKRDRFSRCHDAAEHGCDGSTHAEHIDDFSEFGKSLFDEARRTANRADWPDDSAEDEYLDQVDAIEKSFAEDCYKTEAWHAKNGSLEQEVG